MHLLPVQSRSLDEDAPAVDLALTPADILVLSFTDTDLAVAAAAWDAERDVLPSIRLIALGRLKHPYSVDLFIDDLAADARFVLVRLLGGADYWRYGVDELAAAARRHGFALAILPGCDHDDPRLAAASTMPAQALATLRGYFEAGGIANMRQALRAIAAHLGRPIAADPPIPLAPAGLHVPACRPGDGAHALVLFYRSALLAADTAPIDALADALAARGARVSVVFVTSLKDAASAATLGAWLDANRPEVILNTTAFSARDDRSGVLDRADVPVLQAVLSGAERAGWETSLRGLGPADLAMNVVLPEIDGRLAAGPISFKGAEAARADLEFARIAHRPDPDGIAHAADLAFAWAALRRTPRGDRRLACILPDYPGKQGRAGYAVGLDTGASVGAIAEHLRHAGFDVGQAAHFATPRSGGADDRLSGRVMLALTEAAPEPILALTEYRHAFAALPASFTAGVAAAWGDPADDPDCVDGAFRHRVLRFGKLIVAVQPDRGSVANRRAEFHDPALPPRHGYVAFHLWLRQVERCHALIHLGAHGTLEWLPGKAVALGAACPPRVLAGPTPVIYPFICNNPGEAAQAKRRLGALTIGHLTPPLIEAGTHGDTAELEQLFDEYAEALMLDGRRARLLAAAILDRARDTGLLPAGGGALPTDQALDALDAWLCDIKEARIGDGLHVFGGAGALGRRHREERDDEAIPPALPATANDHRSACGPAELDGLLRALDGRFVPPGPSGAPERRAEVLPTGRNLYAVDPRAVPTRTAWTLGARMAEELVTRYAQDHGEWPRAVVLDLWGSATMRTGGDDLAQALALIGARPRWDHGSARVSGFDILPLATLGRARVDATLRISGLFRDSFPDAIAVFDAAVRAVAGLDEPDDDNPLAAARRRDEPLPRVFGAAPGAYGVGVARRLGDDPEADRASLGEAYLDATSHAYGASNAAVSTDAFRERVAAADAFSHTDDLPGEDLLDSDTIAEHQGGFAAAAALLGRRPALYHVDASKPDGPRLRPLADAVTAALHARATNPRWIAGQMRHGHRGAIALGETLDALYTYAATTDVVPSRHFDRYFDATLGDDAVRAFLERENPEVARGMAERFEAARACGAWSTQRNTVAAVLGRYKDRRAPAPDGRAAAPVLAEAEP